MGSSPTSSLTLVVVEYGMMVVMSMSRTKRTDALSTSVIVEDGSEHVGHDDERSVDVSTGEGWGVNRSNGRSYILGPVVNQDPGGNIDKDQISVEQRVVYSIYYKGTLVLPWRGERGVALAGCVW